MSSTKYVKIPKSIHPIDGGPEYSFLDMIRYVVDHEPRFQSPISNVRTGVRILAAFEEPVDGVSELKEEDQKFLLSILDEPSCGYANWFFKNPETKQIEKIKTPSRAYISFVDAVDEATNSDPRPKRSVMDRAS